MDISRFVRELKAVVESHYLGNGAYCRWLWQNEKKTRRLGVNEYGCADAANILYSIDEFVCSDEDRRLRIEALQSLQNPDTGMFTEETHHTIHTTAHCAGALELFNVRPKYPIKGLRKYLKKEKLYELMEGLDWFVNPWSQSHLGAGVYAALANSGEATPEFCEDYFAWFRENADSVTGFWKPGYSDVSPWFSDDHVNKGAPRYYFMAGGFHYLFNHEHAHQPMPYPERVIDTCLEMYSRKALGAHFCASIGFLEVDWLYCLNRACRQRPTYRAEESIAAIEDFAVAITDYLLLLDTETHDGVNDLHALFGTVCALAELQAALPGKIVTDKPLRLVLDRRPFI
ncbi:MAG: hypothetical protein IKB34_00955 [Clostridia bacterium]|nr:hypothetical protein [Clostridia bacterium]